MVLCEFNLPPDFFRRNPFRPLRWRADHVLRLLEQHPHTRPLERYDDQSVRAYFYLLRGFMDAGCNLGQRERVMQEWPQVYHAHLLYADPDAELRQMLEARLLTTETLAEIAERLGTDEQTVYYYEQLFFHVRDRLQHRGWITLAVLRPPADLIANQHGDIAAVRRRYLLRWAAYHGGPLVLDNLINEFSAETMPQQADEAAAWTRKTQRSILRSRTLQAAVALPIDKTNVQSLLKLGLRAHEATAAGAAGTQDDQTENLNKILEAMRPFLPGDAEPKPSASPGTTPSP